MKTKIKNFVSLFLRFGLSFGLLWVTFRVQNIDIPKITGVLKTADMTYIMMAGIVFLVLNFMLLFRWFVYIWGLEVAVPLSVATRYFFIGLFGNLFMPTAIGGDIIKIFGLCHYSGRSERPAKAKVVASVLLDRLSGFAGIVVVGILAFAVGFRLINDVTLLISIVMLGLLSVGIGVGLFNERIYSFCCRAFNRLPKIKKALMDMHYDIALLKDRKYALYQSVALSVAAQVVAAFFFYLIGKALHQDILVIYFLIFVPLIAVASAMPSIGGLGVREAGMVYFLGKVGVGAEIAVSLGLLNFVFMFLIGGLVYLVTKDAHMSAGESDVEFNS